MAIRITCPGCETSLKLNDDQRGKKVRCPSCKKGLTVPSMNGKKDDDEEDHDEVEQDEDEEQEERSEKKKKKKKRRKGFPVLLAAIGGGVLLLLLSGGGVLIYIFTRPPPQQQANNPPPPPPPPQPPQGQVAGIVKNPKTLLGNIRARGAQAERDAEMVGIVRLYHAYCDEVKNPKNRNLEGFLESIRSEAGKIVLAVKNKEYLINFKAGIGGEDIVVYESEMYDRGYFVFRSNSQSGYVTAKELLAAGLAAP